MGGRSYALTNKTGIVGLDRTHHGKRVAYMAAECGKTPNWTTQHIDDLFLAAIFHG